MEHLNILLEEILTKDLKQIILSNSITKKTISKVKIRPVLLQGKLYFQETQYRGNQVFHTNYEKEEQKANLLKWLKDTFRQGEFHTLQLSAVVLVSKKGKVTIKKKQIKEIEDNTSIHELSHNRVKNYILEEGKKVDFLVDLGVQTQDGKIVKSKYDKFRQINRYLEFIEDIIEVLPKDRAVRIIDFGCGKSYLTFAMYYYLHELKGFSVQITGLDLKDEVIKECNQLAVKYQYHDLCFERGDISTYAGNSDDEQVDMVVTLHACDVATDYALAKAMKWNAKVIFAVPCCQHEVKKQISNGTLEPILKYGLIKERISALITDAVRGNCLEQGGYDTQILEFIDMEHTPKNILIRAVKNPRKELQNSGSLEEMMKFLNITPSLTELIDRTL